METTKATEKATKALTTATAKFVQSCIDEVKAGENKQQTALKMLIAYGFDVKAETKANEVVLKSCKKAVKIQIEVSCEPFAVGDGSKADKLYKSACSALQMQSAEGRRTDGKGKANGTRGNAKADKGDKTNTVVNRQAATITPIELPQEMVADLELEREFKGSIADFMDVYETEVFAYIASDEDILSRLLKFIKDSPKVKE